MAETSSSVSNPNTTNKTYMQNRLPLLISVSLLLLVIGAGIGYSVAYLKNQGPSTANVSGQTDPVLINLERLVEKTRTTWKSLVSEYQLITMVKGSISAINIEQSGARAGYANITLNNNGDNVKFTVFADSDYRSGKYLEYQTWTKITAADLKVGDNVMIAVQAQVNDQSSLDTFFGNFVFRQN